MSGSLEHELKTHASALRELARLLVGPQEAEDLVQDAALQALHRPPERTAGLRGWLLAVLRHRASKHRRTEQRRQRKERGAPLPEPGTTPQRIAEHKETMTRLHAALIALPEPYLGTLLLRFFEDLTPTEIAEQTAVPLATVKSRLQRGLVLLRERLDAGHGEWRRPMAVAFGIGPLVPAAVVAGTGVLMASGTKFVLAAAVVVLGVAGWLWFGTEPRQPGLAGAGVPGAELASGTVDRPGHDLGSSGGIASDARSEVDPRRGEPRPGYLRLRVVRAEDEAPLAGAEVWYADRDLAPLTPTNGQAEVDLSGNPFARLVRQGHRVITDAAGEVDVPQENFGTQVAAAAGERDGWATLTGIAPEGGHVLRLGKRNTLRVSVRHADGTPAAGAPVAKFPREGGERVHMLGLTDQNGRLETRGLDSPWPQLQWCLGIAAPGLQALRVPFDPLLPPAEPVVLTLPPTGTVQLVAEDGQGRPITAQFEISVHRLRDGSAGPVGRQVATDVHGRATMPYVPLGERLRASVVWPGLVHVAGVPHDFAGPVHAGEIVTVLLVPADQDAVVRGRLLTESGQAAALMSLAFTGEATLRDGKTSRWATFTSSGADGGFCIPIIGGAAATEVRGRLTVAGTRRRFDGRFAEFRVVVHEAVRHHDAGTLQLASPGVVMTGSVVLDDGSPVERAWFEADSRAARSGDGVQASGPWPVLVQLDEQGRFTLFESDPPPPAALQVTVRGCQPAKLPVVRGARDVQVVLTRGCTVTVEVRLPTEAKTLACLRAQLSGGGSIDLTPGTGDPRTCQWSPLQPGTYRLAIWALGGTEPVAERTVTLAAEGAHRSRREVFDLGGIVRSARVSLVKVTGEPVLEPGLLVTSAVSEYHGQRVVDAFTTTGGSAAFATSGTVMAFEVVVSGYAVQQYSGPVADVVLTLQPAPEVTVAVAGLEVPPDFSVALTAKDPDRGFSVRSEGRFGMGRLLDRLRCDLVEGIGRLRLSRASRLQWTLVLRRGEARQNVPLPETSWTPGQERIDLAVDGAQLREALARLR